VLYPRKIKIAVELLILPVLFAFLLFVGKNKLAAFYYNRGCSFLENNLYDKAIDSFNKSIKVSPLLSKTHYSLANAYDADNQIEKAIKEYKKAIELDAHFLWGYEALVDIYFRKGEFQEATSLLKEAEANVSNSQDVKELIKLASFKEVAYFINSGVDAFSSGEKSKGYELLNRALRIDPDFVFTYYTLGYFYYSEHKYDEALDILNKADRLDSEFLFTHKLLGDIYFAKKDFVKAIGEYKKALLINSQDPVILSNLGLSFMNLEEYSQAILFLEQALKLDPQNINFRYSLASLYRDAGRIKESALEYKKITQEQPNYLNVHNDLADIYKKDGNNKEAFAEYQKEIDSCQLKLLTTPGDLVLLNSIAYAYNGLGQYAKAKALIDKVLEAKPDYREAYLTLANIQENLKEYQSALESLEKAKGLSNQRQVFIEQKIDDLREQFKSINREMKFQTTQTVYLKNGRHFEGVIINETKDRIVLEINIGNSKGSVMFSKGDIERIVDRNR
jgi:tetratricopeptide (TPR) repeat protein